MAWNRSKVENGNRRTENGGKLSILNLRIAVAAVVILAVIGGAAWWVSQRGDDGDGQAAAKPARTNAAPSNVHKEVKPVQAGQGEAEAEPKDDGQWHPPKNAYKDERGIWRYPGGMRVYDPTRPRKTTNLRMEGDKPSIFRHRAEKEIERLLTLESGRPMFGTRRYDENFEKSYLESLEEPIIITKDDSDEDRMLKQMMIDTKIEISDRMHNGETLKEILEQTRSELQRMAEYKRMLQQSIAKDLKSGMSEQDLDDYVKAANIMLEQNGIPPIRNTAILKRNIRLNMKGTRQ